MPIKKEFPLAKIGIGPADRRRDLLVRGAAHVDHVGRFSRPSSALGKTSNWSCRRQTSSTALRHVDRHTPNSVTTCSFGDQLLGLLRQTCRVRLAVAEDRLDWPAAQHAAGGVDFVDRQQQGVGDRPFAGGHRTGKRVQDADLDRRQFARRAAGGGSAGEAAPVFRPPVAASDWRQSRPTCRRRPARRLDRSDAWYCAHRPTKAAASTAAMPAQPLQPNSALSDFAAQGGRHARRAGSPSAGPSAPAAQLVDHAAGMRRPILRILAQQPPRPGAERSRQVRQGLAERAVRPRPRPGSTAWCSPGRRANRRPASRRAGSRARTNRCARRAAGRRPARDTCSWACRRSCRSSVRCESEAIERAMPKSSSLTR